MKQKVKELRVKIDGLAQLTKGLDYDTLHPYAMGGTITTPSKQVLKATDSLYLAKAWLGKVLGELGEDSPYPKDGTRKTVEDIEETADKATESNPTKDGRVYEQRNHIEKVDWLRQEIKNVIDVIVNFGKPAHSEIFTASREMAIARTNAYTYLCEARFWLGFELERIKEQDKVKKL